MVQCLLWFSVCSVATFAVLQCFGGAVPDSGFSSVCCRDKVQYRNESTGKCKPISCKIAGQANTMHHKSSTQRLLSLVCCWFTCLACTFPCLVLDCMPLAFLRHVLYTVSSLDPASPCMCFLSSCTPSISSCTPTSRGTPSPFLDLLWPTRQGVWRLGAFADEFGVVVLQLRGGTLAQQGLEYCCFLSGYNTALCFCLWV